MANVSYYEDILDRLLDDLQRIDKQLSNVDRDDKKDLSVLFEHIKKNKEVAENVITNLLEILTDPNNREFALSADVTLLEKERTGINDKNIYLTKELDDLKVVLKDRESRIAKLLGMLEDDNNTKFHLKKRIKNLESEIKGLNKRLVFYERK